MAYTFIEDPGHGWLQVPIAELFKLGIQNQITSYSYVNGIHAYLEEDCDFSTFYRAKEARGEPVEYERVYQEHTPVRNYPRYTKAQSL